MIIFVFAFNFCLLFSSVLGSVDLKVETDNETTRSQFGDDYWKDFSVHCTSENVCFLNVAYDEVETIYFRRVSAMNTTKILIEIHNEWVDSYVGQVLGAQKVWLFSKAKVIVSDIKIGINKKPNQACICFKSIEDYDELLGKACVVWNMNMDDSYPMVIHEDHCPNIS